MSSKTHFNILSSEFLAAMAHQTLYPPVKACLSPAAIFHFQWSDDPA
jgi:hypothetical protein